MTATKGAILGYVIKPIVIHIVLILNENEKTE